LLARHPAYLRDLELAAAPVLAQPAFAAASSPSPGVETAAETFLRIGFPGL